MKTAVLIHGHHLRAATWDNVAWGDPRNGVYGRIPAGLREALRFDAEVVFFSTGASEKEGLLEGEYSLKTARERIGEMREFTMWEHEMTHAWLDERAVLELTSQVTTDEITTCAKVAVDRGIERLILVSSPTHIARAHKIAISEFSKDPSLAPLLKALYAVASDTCYAGSTVDDVVIIEPPHRPDRPPVRFNETLKEIFLFNDRPELAQELNIELKKVFDAFRARL